MNGHAHPANAKIAAFATTPQASAVAGANGSFNSPSLNPPPSIAALVETASRILERLHGVASGIDHLGEKLIGPRPQPNASAGDNAPSPLGSILQLEAFLSQIHGAISLLDVGVARLHDIHG